MFISPNRDKVFGIHRNYINFEVEPKKDGNYRILESSEDGSGRTMFSWLW